MDQTKLFKATVRTLNLRNRERHGGAATSTQPASPQETSSQFISLARDVVSLRDTLVEGWLITVTLIFECVIVHFQVVFISKLQAFLLKHRKNYIDSARSVCCPPSDTVTECMHTCLPIVAI